MITFDATYALLNDDILSYQKRVDEIHASIIHKTGLGNDYLGWVEWPISYDKEEIAKIKKVAKQIRQNCDVFIVCGVGGSYLGARAAIEMLRGIYTKDKPEIIFMGNTFSSTYIAQILEYIQDKDICVNIISKSGTTTEPAVAFRLLKQFLEKKYGKQEAAKRIFATTDKEKGTLKEMANQEGYETFIIPDDIGGRYSVTTAVGLLPMAVAGICIDDVLCGMKKAYHDLASSDLRENHAYAYAVARILLQKAGKKAEMLVSYDPNMTMLSEWWKQLFAESEGKDGKGILPCSAIFSTDLHSIGQFIQEGNKILFETLLWVEQPEKDFLFPQDEENLDEMNYLADKSIDWVNKMSCEGTIKAHVESGNVPNLILRITKMDAENFGYLCYFFFRACAMSCYLQDVNPFNQPGVEIYKRNMFALLGKQ